MTPHELLMRAIARAGSHEKLSRWLALNSRPVTMRTLYYWRATPRNIPFRAIADLCGLCGVAINDITPEV